MSGLPKQCNSCGGFCGVHCEYGDEKMKKKFNNYCAELLHLHPTHSAMDFWNDLNYMAEVVEKLIKNAHADPVNCLLWTNYKNEIQHIGIKQACREFIISTMSEETKK